MWAVCCTVHMGYCSLGHRKSDPEKCLSVCRTAWIKHGVASFEEFWGFPARVTALPCHYGFDNLGPLFQSAGISMVEGMKNGRGLLTGLHNMNRVLFDPAFEQRSDQARRSALEAAEREVADELKRSHHVALQVCMCVRVACALCLSGGVHCVFILGCGWPLPTIVE